MSTVYLNGNYLPIEQAHVPVLDRGFLFGDGVYEVIPVYGGRLFRLHEHLDRLGRSLDAIRVRNPMDAAQWEAMLSRLVEDNDGSDQSVYLQVTRGAAAKRDHAFPDGAEPTVFAMSSPLAPPDLAAGAAGIEAITLDDIRWQNCHIKAITLLPNVLMRQQAVEQGAAEAILVRDGRATEGAASNLFMVDRNTLITPPKDNNILPGITRDLIVELAALNGIPCLEQTVTTEQLRQADEIWLTSSTKEIMPVTRLDGETVGSGTRGPLCERMQGIYRGYVDALREGRDLLG